MGQRIFGLETEYAFSAFDSSDARVPQEVATRSLMGVAAKALPHLRGRSSSGLFLQNGSRLYVDQGHHPELSTPEVVHPWDACRYALAGDRILNDLSNRLETGNDRIAHVFVTRCNVNYSSRPTTWGCHESYGHRADPGKLGQEIIPHLVSRVVYCGAGGFNNRSAGLEFMLSPRVAHLEQVFSGSSTCDRGIIHGKDEPLGQQGYHRLHILCGESLCSHKALWLKTAVTALVVAMIEARLRPFKTIHLEEPLEAMRQFALDPHCQARAKASGGRFWTALEIQRHLLFRLEAHADHPVMPGWAPVACKLLRDVLDRIEQGPAAVADTLDWAIKLSLYRRVAKDHGVDWDCLSSWNRKIGESVPVPKELDPRFVELSDPQFVERTVGGRPMVFCAERPRRALRQPVLSRSEPSGGGRRRRNRDLEPVLSLRDALFALDTRFAQVGEQGVFATLDRSGVLDHVVEGVDKIDQAVISPPETGRAAIRGRTIRRLRAQNGRFCCEWTGIWDLTKGLYLDLSDPLAAEERWQPTRRNDESTSTHEAIDLARLRHLHRGAIDLPRFVRVHREATNLSQVSHLQIARHLVDQGRYDQAFYVLWTRLTASRDLPREVHLATVCLLNEVQGRRGLVATVPMSDGPVARGHFSLEIVNAYMGAYRFRGLLPAPEMALWADKGMDSLLRYGDPGPEALVTFHEHYAYLMMTKGRLRLAHSLLEDVLARYRQAQQPDRRAACRAKALFGETCRRLGRNENARSTFEEVQEEQAALRFNNDLANHTLLYLAKLEQRPDRALPLLAEAERTHAQLRDQVGEARTLLLKARLAPEAALESAIKERVLRLKDQLPALGDCQLLRKIIAGWAAWTDGGLEPDETGDAFWGL